MIKADNVFDLTQHPAWCPRSFDARWKDVTDQANDLSTSNQAELAAEYYAQATHEARRHFLLATFSGEHAGDVVPMMVVSAGNAASNLCVLGRPKDASFQLEAAAQVILETLEDPLAATELVQACVMHLPRLYVELDAGVQGDRQGEPTGSCRELRSRLNAASLAAVKRMSS